MRATASRNLIAISLLAASLWHCAGDPASSTAIVRSDPGVEPAPEGTEEAREDDVERERQEDSGGPDVVDAGTPSGDASRVVGDDGSVTTSCPPLQTRCSVGCCAAGKTKRTMAAGLWFTCAITSAGTVKCWGWNVDGQLGQGNTGYGSNTPLTVPNLSNVVALSAGNSHACALTSAGSVLCWGANDFGQLGGGSVQGHGPVTVAGLGSGVLAVSAGRRHTCAVTSARTVKCWGRNHRGTLGEGTTGDSLTPVDVGSLPTGGVALLSSGGLSLEDFPTDPPSSPNCALSMTGQLKCFGAFVETPVSVTSDIADVSARGEEHRCVLNGRGEVWCWGLYNGVGQLGPPTPAGGTTVATALRVATPPDVVEVETGGSHSCVRTRAGSVQCWGYNSTGQLGTGRSSGNTDFSRTPVDVIGLPSPVVEVAAGTRHTCVRTDAGKVFCWGSDSYGALGRTGNPWTPGEVPL